MRARVLAFAVATIAMVTLAAPGCDVFFQGELVHERLCTPQAYVFCMCANLARGTKRCRDDGESFEPCASNDSGECIGGEVPDPQTNEPVPTDPTPVVPVSEADACPGQSVALAAGVEKKIEGNTRAAREDRKGRNANACAAGAGANDHVYRITPQGSGTLAVRVQGSDGLAPVTYLLTTCNDGESQENCGPPTPQKVAQFTAKVLGGKDYFLVIDGISGSKGAYVASLRFSPGPFCGNGEVDPGEACDDLNHIANDGCGPDCRNVSGNPSSGGKCPGHPVTVWEGQTVTGSGSTNGYGNAWSSPSAACDFAGSNPYSDHLYEVTPKKTGNLVVSLSAPSASTLPDLMLTARRACTGVTSVTANTCSNAGGSGVPETMTVPVIAGEKVIVAVDGGGGTNSKGDYVIAFEIR